MSDLPARLEAATEGSGELDAEVLWEIFQPDRRAVFDGVRHISTITCANGDFWFEPLPERTDCPRYTTSADDAMELLKPPGSPLWTAIIDIRSFGQHGMSYDVEITIPSREFQGHSNANLPLAICAAALRARAG